MRLTALLIILLALPASPAFAADRIAPPASAANLLRYRPAPWHLPAAVRMGMRLDPETGEVAELFAPESRSATVATLRRNAAATARTRADGSRHATLGAAFRSYTVVRISADGRLVSECLDDADAAKARVDATREVPR